MLEILRCPACGAADRSPAGQDGAHTCAFCGVRYGVRAGTAAVIPTARPGAAPARLGAGLAVGAAVVLLFAGGVGAAFLSADPGSPGAADAPVPPVPPVPPIPVLPSVVAPVVSESAAPPAEPAASATFVEHGVRPGVNGAFWVLGVVTNTSPWPIESPRFDTVLLDAAGAEVGVDRSYGNGSPLAAGASEPVALLVADAPAHARYRTEVRPVRLRWSPEMADGLALSEFPPTAGSYGGWEASGSVRNGGTSPALFVHVVVAAWDAKGTLIGVANGYAAGQEGIPAEGVARYAIRVDTGKATPARFTTQVTGRR
jgi:hypothetical protein